MPPDTNPSFTDKDAEIAYLKEKLKSLEEKLFETEKDFDEFREFSATVEKELEKSIEAAEITVKDLRTKCNLLTFDLDASKGREDELNKQNLDLANTVKEYRESEQKFLNYIRELEEKNDDLERCNRRMMATLDDVQTQLDGQIEKNALLETDLVQVDELQVMVQRLKDEKRDLQQELDRQRLKFSDNNHVFGNHLDSNKLSETQTNGMTVKTNTFPPTQRAAAVNLVGDLLRKVGCLESKLAGSRLPKDVRSSPNPNSSRMRNQRLHRGPSSPTLQNAVKFKF